jgi:Protein of unknown function (DUF742)
VLVRLAVGVVGDSGELGMEVSRLFRSLGSSGANNPASVQAAALIDEAVKGLSPVRGEYRARHAQPEDDAGVPRVPDAAEPSLHTAMADAADEWAVDEWDGPDDFRFVVRPYSWTQGRTRPAQDLAVETLVSTSDKGRDLTSICSAEHAAIAQLCTDMRSVAEVAALLSLPLGVARVLLADMIDTGLVHVHRNPTGWGDAPDLGLLERVLDGLYRL